MPNRALRAASIVSLLASAALPLAAPAQSPAGMDGDLLEVTVPKLQGFYADHKYTVTQVTNWYLDRIRRYNPVYAPLEYINAKNALATAAEEDARLKDPAFHPGPLFGIPIVIKENTSIAGLVTSDGWKGYTLPGHELIAPRDATIVAKLRAAGAIILGKTNMPDFAASDTNRSSAFGRTGNAYDVRFSPGGSSGGTVTAVTANLAVLGNGTDTGNSIRMPAATSAVVGVFPTRGLVSIAGIAPLDWLLDNTGPIARTVTDAAVALTVMASDKESDPLDPPTAEASSHAQPGPYTQYLHADALKGKRFGVPAFILSGAGIPFQGIPSAVTDAEVAADRKRAEEPLRPETRAAFLKAVDALRAAGATVVIDDTVLPDSFALTASRIGTFPYIREGTESFLAHFGPPQYHSAAQYQKAVGSPLPPTIIGNTTTSNVRRSTPQVLFEGNPQAGADVLKPRAAALAMFNDTLDRLHLDGYVYPAIQMPPVDETMPQNNGADPNQISTGPHSATGWVNMLGVPAVVVPAGFYANGLPFGLEISTRRWHDGDLLGYAYAFEQATHLRHPPVLVDRGLIGVVPNQP
ncbi:MAG TPA: amidase [Acidobacteriaceae bacterium]|nr:amidase [Acidobacteriaceae bacterium]